MLTFVGLGLFDKTDISVKGRMCIERADEVFLECYTSRLMGTSIEELEEFYKKPIRPLYREDVEQKPDAVLALAQEKDVVFLCAGDPMVSTTHADLRIRAAERGIPTAIVHAASISSAVCGLSGLQNYRFGKSCSLPFPQKNWFPTTPLDVISQNLAQRLHTLVYLDIQNERYMTVPEAVELYRTDRKGQADRDSALCRHCPGRIRCSRRPGRLCGTHEIRRFRAPAPYPHHPCRAARHGTGVPGEVCRVMKIRECQVLLSAGLGKTRSTVPPGTALGSIAAGELEMVSAYLSDGTGFSSTGDPVNALASFYYAFGWLHFGCAYGALITDMKNPPCPFLGPCERLPVPVLAKLNEKTTRYERLLDTARRSVTCAPDPSTPAYRIAARTLQIAETYASRGRWLLDENRQEDALAGFSYGHGWLDAGVRAGLFTVVAERDLFTV